MDNYISIKSVISDIATLLGEDQIDDGIFLEWATKGLRKINTEAILHTKVKKIELSNHRAELPKDLVYLTQVMASANTKLGESNLDQMSCFLPMRMTTNTFHSSVCLNSDQLLLSSCVDCLHEFSINKFMCLTSTMKEGTLLVSYLTYPEDEEGYALIPNDEDLKEALVYYILYRYWQVRYNAKEEGADTRLKFYQGMWQTMSTKSAGRLNMPGISKLENLKNIQNRLVRKEDGFNTAFSNVGSNETRNF